MTEKDQQNHLTSVINEQQKTIDQMKSVISKLQQHYLKVLAQNNLMKSDIMHLKHDVAALMQALKRG